MKKLIYLILFLIIILGLSKLVSAQQASDKYDGGCSVNATQGRCADKPLINPPQLTIKTYPNVNVNTDYFGSGK